MPGLIVRYIAKTNQIGVSRTRLPRSHFRNSAITCTRTSPFDSAPPGFSLSCADICPRRLEHRFTRRYLTVILVSPLYHPIHHCILYSHSPQQPKLDVSVFIHHVCIFLYIGPVSNLVALFIFLLLLLSSALFDCLHTSRYVLIVLALGVGAPESWNLNLVTLRNPLTT